MKNLIIILILLISSGFLTNKYDSDYVTFSSNVIESSTCKIVKLERRDNHIKARYFAVKDIDGKSVPDRYKSWAVGKNIVTVCSGTYMDKCEPNAKPVSLTIDQGNIINNTISSMDGVATFFSSGEIVVGNIKSGELKIANVNYDLKIPIDKNKFMSWAKNNKATVFQTHLLIFKNELFIYDNSNATARERRFLAGCTDVEGNKYEYIFNFPEYITLLDAARKTKKYLNQKEEMKTIDYLINLDTGCQDFFEGYNSTGQKKEDFQGTNDIRNSINLVSFYYE